MAMHGPVKKRNLWAKQITINENKNELGNRNGHSKS